MTFKHQWVHFRICDVYYPDAGRVLTELHGEDLLQGRVIEMSDSGDANAAFAVVEVDGLRQPVIVPATSILGVL